MPTLTYLGHSAFLLQSEQAALAIDPFLSGNPKATIGPDDLKVQYVLVSHGHGDHVGDAIQIAKANRATIVAPYELALYCQRQDCQVHPMHIGGSFQFPFGRVKLTIAHHGSMTPDGGYGGNPCGFLVTMEGKTLYHTGDTGLFYDMKLIGELTPIHVALLPIGDNFTMGIDDAVKAVELLQPRLAIPMHYDTFDMIQANPEDFVRRVRVAGYVGKVLPVGASHAF